MSKRYGKRTNDQGTRYAIALAGEQHRLKESEMKVKVHKRIAEIRRAAEERDRNEHTKG